MKIVIIQKDITNPYFLDAIADCAGLEPDLLLLNELATSGCLYDGGQPADLEQILSELKKYSFGIMLGLPRQTKNGLKNSYMYYHNGDVQYYDKINLFPPMNEDKVYQAGEKPGIFNTEFGKIGAAICYDVRFPEIFTNLKELGAEMIVVPAAFPHVRISFYKDLLVTRAKETGLPVIGINAVGDDGVNLFGGSSMVVDGNGKVLAMADEINESIIEVSL